MKTTVEISDALLQEAKNLAHQRKQTLRSLVEEGLQHILEQNKSPEPPVPEAVVFGGQGRSPEFEGASWQALRDAAYQGHGA
ncbi:MAG: type II toxin-antitoxin system VapB family antitoxin [Opitutales bacterium]